MKRLLFVFLLIPFFSVSQDNGIIQLDTLDMSDSIVIVINDMRVTGNKSIKENVVFGESKLSVGDTIQLNVLNTELKESRRNLLNLTLFTDVEIFIEEWTDDNHIDIVFEVRERWYIYPLPILELSGITFQEWKDDYDYDFERVSYGANVTHENLTKRADKLKATVKRGFQENYSLSYSNSGIDKDRNWGISFGAGTSKNKGTVLTAEDNEFDAPIFDETVSEFHSVSFGISHRKDIIRRHSLGIRFLSHEVADTIIHLQPEYFNGNDIRQNATELVYGFSWEKRNLAEYATEGYSIEAYSGYNGLIKKNLNSFKVGGSYNRYLKLNTNHFLSGAVSFRYLKDNKYNFFNAINNGIGDLQKPRMYDSYRLFPKSFIGLKSEYRYDWIEKQFSDIPILPDRFEPVPFRVLPKVFLDVNRTFSNKYVEQNELNNDLLYSYGVGVDVVTIYNTPIIIEFGRNHLGENSLNFGVGKTF